MAHGQAGAPSGNQNRKGRGIKQKKRIQVSMSISDHADKGNGTFADLRERFEDYLLNQGIQPTEDEIKSVARQWAYESWWHHLERAEDAQAKIV